MATRAKCAALTHQRNGIAAGKTGTNRLCIRSTTMHINTMSCTICTEEVRISTTVSIAISVLICHLRSFNRIWSTAKSINHHGCYSRTATGILHGRILCIPSWISLIVNRISSAITAAASIASILNLAFSNHLVIYIRRYDIHSLLLFFIITSCILDSFRYLVCLVTAIRTFSEFILLLSSNPVPGFGKKTVFFLLTSFRINLLQILTD